MTTKFYPKPTYFEKKSQVVPNSLIFHREMTDAAKIFILALNGIATCAPGWTPIQCDLQKRLGWGREKMQKTIKECVRLGYLQVKQSRILNDDEKGKKGRFSHNEFYFDTEPSFLENKENLSSEEPSHNEYEPMTGKPSTVNQALPISLIQPLEEGEKFHKILADVDLTDVEKRRLSKLPEEKVIQAVKSIKGHKPKKTLIALILDAIKNPTEYKPRREKKEVPKHIESAMKFNEFIGQYNELGRDFKKNVELIKNGIMIFPGYGEFLLEDDMDELYTLSRRWIREKYGFTETNS
jgi:hypothetical protein